MIADSLVTTRLQHSILSVGSITDKTKISKERSLIFSKRFNKWLKYDGWNTLTGKDDLKDVCDELNTALIKKLVDSNGKVF